jgi:RNA polymerase sigma factor (sigma-70 family)
MEQSDRRDALLDRNRKTNSRPKREALALNRHRTVPNSLHTLFHAGSFTGLTDGQLLERFAVRDEETAEAAFAALVDRHGPMVLRTCLTVLRDEHEAHDAFQVTFLVLVRKAGSLWVQDSLGPWLHRVAYHAAARARRASVRRKFAEGRAAEMIPERAEARTWDDLGVVLHEEVDRLPQRYRIPVVLCDLEERSYEEAARHLGCPVGTVKSRLARGREQLKKRLARRGLADPAGMLTTGFPAAGEKAALPATLVSDMIRLATGKAAAGPVPVSVAILVKEVLKSMIMKKWGAIISALFILGVVSIGASILMPKGGDPQAIATTATVEPSADDPETKLERIHGTWVRVSANGVKEEITIRMKATKDSDKPKVEIPAGAAQFVFEWRPEGHDAWGQKVILDSTQAPKTIDFLTDDPAAPMVWPGIYRLEGDILTMCIRPVHGPRPAGFVALKPGEVLDVYQREKSDASRSTKPVAPAAGWPANKVVGHDAARIDGNWIVRRPYGNALTLLNIEVQGQQPRVSLLPVDDPKVYQLPESKIENLCMDENSIRFNIRLVSDRNTSGSIVSVDAYLPEGEAQPKILLGSLAMSRSRFPVELERTELKVLDRAQASASAPGSEALKRFDQIKDFHKKRETLEGILEKHGDRPLAPIAAWCLAIVLADAHASQVEVRSAADRAIRLAARYGSEMELAAVHRVADHLVASEILPDLALDYARKADAMLEPADTVALQTAVLKNLASVLRRAGRTEETKAVEDRLSKITDSADAGNAQALVPRVGRSRTISGRRRASPPSEPRPRERGSP